MADASSSKSQVSGLGHDAEQARAALRTAAGRAAELLRAVPDPNAAVPGLVWNVSETAAHMVAELRDYRSCVLGERPDDTLAPDSANLVQHNAQANTRQLEKFAERDLSRLADMLPSTADDFLTASEGISSNMRIPTLNGPAMTVSTMSPVLLGEILVHGFDISRATGVRWSISRADALTVISGLLAVIPDYVDRRRAAGRSIGYELRFRGGSRVRMAIRDGKASVGDFDGKIDCWISADPVAFLLLGFGRIGQWGQIARGRMIAGGRKPWLAMEFSRLVTSP